MTLRGNRFRAVITLLALCLLGFLVWSILSGKLSGYEIVVAMAVLLVLTVMAVNGGKNRVLNWALMSVLWASLGIPAWIRGNAWGRLSYGILSVGYAVLALWEWRDRRKSTRDGTPESHTWAGK
jgi:hypothetical protein